MTEDKTLLFNGLMDAFPEGIIAMDMGGIITRLNKGAIDILGYNSVNLIGKPIFDFSPSFARDDIKDLFKQLEAVGTVKDRKIQLYDVKGKLRNLKISLILLRDAKAIPIGILSTIQDIKDVALLEKELEELQDLFHDIIDNAGVGIVATDLKGNIIFANLGAKNLFKKPLEEMIGVNIIKDSQAPRILNEKFNNLIKTGNSFEYESEVLEKGKVRNFINIFTLLRDRDKNPAGAIVVFKDLSRLKEIESQLKNSNAILKEYTKNLESLVEV
ncbi:MAG: PAS domain-containing protein, partial [Candidatus Hydrothermarchaeales archaeon]